jgi:pimeloyl-ACP methyl ester carboxylesterase
MALAMPTLEGVEHREVTAGGIRVHVAEAGPQDSTLPPVLLLHGWPQHWYMWRHVIAGLRPGFRLLAPDLRGFGWTEAPGSGYDGETFAADQVALMDALGIDRAFVISHDWGGWTAMLMGVLHPGRVERIVVLNSPHPWPRLTPGLALEAWRSWYTWVLATPGLGRRTLRSGWMARRILSNGNVGTPFTPAELELFVDSFREPRRADAIVRLYRYYQRAFREGVAGRWEAARLDVPTLLLFGERDLYISPRLVDGRPPQAGQMQIELVPDSGHFIAAEKPELVIERAAAFLASG